MRLLITGASGLLGKKLVALAIDAGHEVHSVYNTHPLTEGKPQRLDLTDERRVSQAITEKAPDVVVHAASLTDVDLCEREPELAMRVNGMATAFIAQACKRIECFVVYVSTDYVFDGIRGHYNEDDEPNPINVYGRSKLLGEKELSRFSQDSCTARTSVVYGWGREHRPNFATWLYSALSAGHKINVVVDQYASPTLNNHLARMILEVVERRVGGYFHLAGKTRASRYEFAVRLARRFRFDENLLTPVKSECVNWKAERPSDSSLNVGKALKMLNNKPVTLDEALDEFAQEAIGR